VANKAVACCYSTASSTVLLHTTNSN